MGSESIGDEILIHGRDDMNRAFDGDVVAVELLPAEQWQGNSSGKIVEDGKCGTSFSELANLLYILSEESRIH